MMPSFSPAPNIVTNGIAALLELGFKPKKPHFNDESEITIFIWSKALELGLKDREMYWHEPTKEFIIMFYPRMCNDTRILFVLYKSAIMLKQYKEKMEKIDEIKNLKNNQ